MVDLSGHTQRRYGPIAVREHALDSQPGRCWPQPAERGKTDDSKPCEVAPVWDSNLLLSTASRRNPRLPRSHWRAYAHQIFRVCAGPGSWIIGRTSHYDKAHLFC